MTWFRVGGAGVPVSLKNGMNAVLNKKFGTSGQNYPPNSWPDDVNLLGPLPEKIVAGAIAHTDDAADTVPVKSMICSIVPKQAGTGTPSPTNVRALSGYTGLTIIQLGKNILNINASIEEPNPTSLNVSPRILEDFKWYKGLRSDNYYYPNYITYSVGSGSITVTNSNSSNAYGMSYCFPIRPSEVFTVSLVCDSSPLFSVGYFDENWNFLGTSSSSYQVTSQTITAHSEAYHAILTLRAPQNTPKTYSSVQIEVGSSATSYEQYITPEINSDSWSSIGAILGGERDLTEGTLKSDMAKDTMSSSYLSGLGSGYIDYAASVPGMNNHPAIWIRNWNYSQMPTFRSGGIKCAINSFPDVRINDSSIMSTQYRVYIDVNGLNITSVQDFIDAVAAMEQNGDSLEIAYELSTPTVYSNLSTYDFETLYAVNNFFSDIVGGQTQVTYRQDIALAFQAVSSSRGLMMASRQVTQLVGEESDPDQVNELVENDENDIREQLNEIVENDETEQEGENDAR